MKVMLAIPGFPPALAGGIEQSSRALVTGLLRAGHEVVVVAGAEGPQDAPLVTEELRHDETSDRPFLLLSVHRPDLFYGHWQKRHSSLVSAAFTSLLHREQPHVLHVHHWIRLTDDLVERAAAAGVPAVVTLHDYFATCLIYFRLQLPGLEPCDAELAPDPCLGCAAALPPRTPWLSSARQARWLDHVRASMRRELRLARRVLALSHDQADRIAQALGPDAPFEIQVETLGQDNELTPGAPLPTPAQLGRLVLGTWGSLHTVKGVDLIVDAVRRLSQEAGGTQLPIELHVAGAEAEPSYVSDLRKRAAGLPIHFHGRYPEGGLARHAVARTHVFVSGTRARETWGLVVDEAVALRLPAVLPAAGALPEHLPEGRGSLLYRHADPSDLARTLQRLIDEPALLPELRRQLPRLADLVPSLDAHVASLLRSYTAAIEAGAPAVPAPGRRATALQRHLETWDRELTRHPPSETGL